MRQQEHQILQGIMGLAFHSNITLDMKEDSITVFTEQSFEFIYHFF